jgi:hypothetical protein
MRAAFCRSRELRLAATHYENFVTAIWADIPGRDGTRNTDNDGAEERRPETSYLEIIQHRRDKTEHCGIQNKNKQPQRHDSQRQCHYKHQRSNDGIDETEEKRSEYEIAGAFNPDSWQQTGGEEQTEHRD